MLNKWHRGLFAAGASLIVLGIFHVLVQFLAPRAWESSIGWRKPILFGLSTGVTLVSLSWACAVVNLKRANLAGSLIAVLAPAEVLIITMQTWRSVPAHFNHGAPIDQILSSAVDAMLIFITLAIFYLTWAALKTRNAAAHWLSALRIGMVFLALACILGFGTAIYGNWRLAANLDPQLIEPRGVPKFVHGIALHAIQILPIWLSFAEFINKNTRRLQQSVHLIAASIGFATLFALWQTLNGMSRFEFNPIAGTFLLGATFSGATAVYLVFVRERIRAYD